MSETMPVTSTTRKHTIKVVEVYGAERYRGYAVAPVLEYKVCRNAISARMIIHTKRELNEFMPHEKMWVQKKVQL